MYHIERSDGQVFDCSGAITIASQIATSFTGTFVLTSCAAIGGTVTSGTFAQDGTISFALTSSGGEPVFIAAAFGCVFLSGDRVLTGTLIGNDLQAEQRAMIGCTTGNFSVFLRVAGSRT
jgi:hypothetical protein